MDDMHCSNAIDATVLQLLGQIIQQQYHSLQHILGAETKDCRNVSPSPSDSDRISMDTAMLRKYCKDVKSPYI